jgi:hypothetical protein
MTPDNGHGRLIRRPILGAKIMNSTAPLTGSHLRTYERIFQHPVSHNLEWRDVHTLFRYIGQVEEEHNGNLKVTRNGQTLVLQPPRTKDVAETEELMALRHFLERSEPTPTPTPTAPATTGGSMHWLLVIDHHEARLFRSELHGAVPHKIVAHDSGYFRHAQNSQNLSRGKEKPDPNTFFGPVATALQVGGPILIFGTGTGTSSEMEQFVAWTKHHHPDLAKRIIGSLVVDENHLTDDQLLAKAREFYANHGVAVT